MTYWIWHQEEEGGNFHLWPWQSNRYFLLLTNIKLYKTHEVTVSDLNNRKPKTGFLEKRKHARTVSPHVCLGFLPGITFWATVHRGETRKARQPHWTEVVKIRVSCYWSDWNLLARVPEVREMGRGKTPKSALEFPWPRTRLLTDRQDSTRSHDHPTHSVGMLKKDMSCKVLI